MHFVLKLNRGAVTLMSIVSSHWKGFHSGKADVLFTLVLDRLATLTYL